VKGLWDAIRTEADTLGPALLEDTPYEQLGTLTLQALERVETACDVTELRIDADELRAQVRRLERELAEYT
jgi:hypothetical protein